MGKKGVPHRKWSKEEKLKYVQLHLKEHVSVKALGREYGINYSLISAWVKQYLEEGEQGLEPKVRPGNRFAALYKNKELTEVSFAFSCVYFCLTDAVPAERGSLTVSALLPREQGFLYAVLQHALGQLVPLLAITQQEQDAAHHIVGAHTDADRIETQMEDMDADDDAQDADAPDRVFFPP